MTEQKKTHFMRLKNFRSFIAGILVVSVMTIAACNGSKSDPAPEPKAKAKGKPKKAIVVEAAAIVSTSCATGGCHGDRPDAKADAWHSSFTIWKRDDKHANAFAVLKDKPSIKMLTALEAGNPEKDTPLNPREPTEHLKLVKKFDCITCHSSSGHIKDVTPEALADGVSCGACHGDDKGWIEMHRQNDGKQFPAADKVELGFVDVTQSKDLATTCVKCHVGSENGDVNHDLIAAGHPRLMFDFALYSDLMPKHWDHKESGDEKKNDPVEDKKAVSYISPDHYAMQWKIGQVESTKAAAKLLKFRASHASKPPWPEFAEYDCLNCHHSLGDNWIDIGLKNEKNLGMFTWGSWHFPQFVWSDDSSEDSTEKGISQLRSELKKPYQILAKPETLQSVLENLAKVEQIKVSDINLSEVVAQQPNMTWDEVTHWYFAARALYINETKKKSDDPKLKQIEENLQQLVLILKMPFDKKTVRLDEQQQRLNREKLKQLIDEIKAAFKSFGTNV